MEIFKIISLFIIIAKNFEKNMPLNLIFSEGWLLRLVLKWFEENRNLDYDITFKNNSLWYSEGALKPYFGKFLHHPSIRNERYTNPDAVYGDIYINDKNSYIELNDDCKDFIVVEAKMYSDFTPETNNKPYDQVSRTICCMCVTLYEKYEKFEKYIKTYSDFFEYLEAFEKIAFYAFLPHKKKFKSKNLSIIDKERIKKTVDKYINDSLPKSYNDELLREHKNWFDNYFIPFLSKIDLKLFSWEEIIEYIKKYESSNGIDSKDNYGNRLEKFYNFCKIYNK